MIRVKRIYAPAERGDGYRLLVDRIWPRGLSKEKASVDQWLKEVAPSTQLRGWFRHDPKKWRTFIARYRAELNDQPQSLRVVQKLMRSHRTVTLLYAARDQQHNNAVALQQILSDNP